MSGIFSPKSRDLARLCQSCRKVFRNPRPTQWKQAGEQVTNIKHPSISSYTLTGQQKGCAHHHLSAIPWAVSVKNCEPAHTDVSSKTPKHLFFSTVALFTMQRDQHTDVLLTYYFTLFNHRIIVRVAVLMLSHFHCYLTPQPDGTKKCGCLVQLGTASNKGKIFFQFWLFSYMSSYKLVAAAHLFLTTQINLSKFLLTGAFWQKTARDGSSLRSSSSSDMSVCQSHTHNHATHHATTMVFSGLFFKDIYIRYIWPSSRQALM